jgi:hypothetical protein
LTQPRSTNRQAMRPPREETPKGAAHVYLDLNKWIDLAHAYYHRRGSGSHRGVLRVVERAVEAGVLRLPFSACHFMEICKRHDRASRRRLIHVLERFSAGWAIATPREIVPALTEAATYRALGRAAPMPLTTPIGRGWQFAWGSKAAALGPLGRVPAVWTFVLENISATAGNIWTPLARALACDMERAKPALQSVSAEMRRRHYAALLLVSIQKHIIPALISSGTSNAAFFSLGPDRLMKLIRSIPPLDVELELVCERNQHWTRPADPNDLVDVDQLSVAIPYCDAVVTERWWCNIARRRKLDERYGTVLLSRLCELTPFLLSRP